MYGVFFLKQINKICRVRRCLYVIIPALFLGACKGTYIPTAHPVNGTRVEKVQSDARIEKRIVPLRAELDRQLSEVVGVSPIPLEKGLPESELSDLIADAAFTYAGEWAARADRPVTVDFCLLNSGGIRTALPAGSLTLRDIYEVMPFENEIVVLKLTPANARALVNYVAGKGGAPVAGIRMKLDGNQAVSTEINGVPYAFDHEVWVATSDFLAYGGDGMTFFAAPEAYLETKIKVRDAIAGYFKRFQAEGKPLPAVKDGRISR